MSLYFSWQTGTIADAGTSTDEIDLKGDCDFVQIIIPELDSCTVKLQVSDHTGGTFQDLGSSVTTDTTTGEYSTMFRLGGYRYIKVVCSAAQSPARTIKVRGMKI